MGTKDHGSRLAGLQRTRKLLSQTHKPLQLLASLKTSTPWFRGAWDRLVLNHSMSLNPALSFPTRPKHTLLCPLQPKRAQAPHRKRRRTPLKRLPTSPLTRPWWSPYRTMMTGSVGLRSQKRQISSSKLTLLTTLMPSFNSTSSLSRGPTQQRIKRARLKRRN